LPAIAQRGGRGEKDHLSVLLVDHVLLRRPRRQERPLQVRVDDRVPVFVGHLEDEVVADDARAGDKDVEPAELRHRAGHHRLDLRAIADIARDGETSDGVRDLARRRVVKV
jgi:hypothetical protein